MMSAQMIVASSWDDGLVDDLQIIDILRHLDLPATFCLCPGLHTKERKVSQWGPQNGTNWAMRELRSVYEGFDVASHTATHLHGPAMTDYECEQAVMLGRLTLEYIFDRPIPGFCYPYGEAKQAESEVVRKYCHYGRTLESLPLPQDVKTELLPPQAVWNAPDFWEKYETARPGGFFNFCGHGFEITGPTERENLEILYKKLVDEGARIVDMYDFVQLLIEAGRVSEPQQWERGLIIT